MIRLRDPSPAETERIRAACLMRQLARNGYGWEDIAATLEAAGFGSCLSKEKIRAYVLRGR